MTNKITTFWQNSTLFINSLFQEWYINSDASLTFRCPFSRTISLWPQNTLQFWQSLLHCSQISFSGAFFLGLQTGTSRWEPDPENTVDGEVIQSAIRAILSLLRPTCDTVHCLGDGFHPLMSTQLTADLTLECSDGSMYHPLSHTAWKNLFYCAETARNSSLNRRRVVVFDRLCANAVRISNRAFSCSNVHAKWLFFMFWGTTDAFGRPERSATEVVVRPLLKSANHFSTICLDGAETG